MRKPKNSSWESVEKWYDKGVGKKGHYYHENVIFPNLLRLLALKEHPSPSLLDIGCGQGVLARQLPEGVPYVGCDLSPSLIKKAKSYKSSRSHKFVQADATKPLPFNKEQQFSHATIILALQNMERPEHVFTHLFPHIEPGGKLFLILNHPCFRVLKQSSWEVDREKMVQYRRIDGYATPKRVSISHQPSRGEKATHTYSFHTPLSHTIQALSRAGFLLHWMEEWQSDKKSYGKAAKMENRCRKEIPLFLALCAIKPK